MAPDVFDEPTPTGVVPRAVVHVLDQPTSPGVVHRGVIEMRIMLLARTDGETSPRPYEIAVVRKGPAHLRGTVRRKVGNGWVSLNPDDELRVGVQLVEARGTAAATGKPRRWQIVDVDAGPPAIFDMVGVER